MNDVGGGPDDEVQSTTESGSELVRRGSPGYVIRGAEWEHLLVDMRKIAPLVGVREQMAEVAKLAMQSPPVASQVAEISRRAFEVIDVPKLSGSLAATPLAIGLNQMAQVLHVMPKIELPVSALGLFSEMQSSLLSDMGAVDVGMHAALSQVLESVRLSEAFLPAGAAGPAMDGVGQLARVALSDSAFTQWRSSTGVEASLSVLAERIGELGFKDGQLADLARVSAATSVLSRRTFDALGSRDVLGTRPMLELENYVGRLTEHNSRASPSVAWSAGHGVSGLVSQDALIAVRGSEDRDEVITTVEARVLTPWEQAAASAREELYGLLDELDPRISDLLRGAWDSVANPGPADVVKVGACAVEALLWALRIAAPDDEVKRWVSSTGRRYEDFLPAGKVTRKARVRYTLRTRKGDVKVVEAQADALETAVTASHDRLQAMKHAASGDLIQARSHLMTTEALLIQLFAVR